MSENSLEIVSRVGSALDQIRHPKNRPLVVGLSGGLDSQVLTHALKQVTDDTGHQIIAVHVDHGLRPGSADDAERVKAICEQLDLACQVTRVDVAAWDKHLNQGTESAARHARYAALARAATDAGTDTIVTGHTLDDQAETILLRLISGSGLEGLGGMDEMSHRPIPLQPGRRPMRRFGIFRPLLHFTRADIEAYAENAGIVAVEDESNQTLEFRRNAVRQNVIPALEAVEQSAKAAIARSARLIRDDAEYLAETVSGAMDDVVAERNGVWMLERQQFRLAHPAIQRRLLFRTVDPLLPPAARLGVERIDALRHAAVNAQPGKVIELAGSVIAYIDYDRVAVGDSETLEDDLRRLSWVPLLEPGTEIPLKSTVDVSLLNGWRVRGVVDSDSEVLLRTRRDGDRTRSANGRLVKLQDWLVDRKVPRYLRDWLPVVEFDGEIRWVIGLDITELPDTRIGVHLHVELDA